MYSGLNFISWYLIVNLYDTIRLLVSSSVKTPDIMIRRNDIFCVKLAFEQNGVMPASKMQLLMIIKD